jgi:hypothetical protein
VAGKLLFVLSILALSGAVGVLSYQLFEFSLIQLNAGKSFSTLWGFWMLVVGPILAAIPAIVGGIQEWISPQIVLGRPPQHVATKSWILPN